MNKIVVAIAVVILSAFLGLFILPRKVETTRWVKVDIPQEVVWAEVSNTKRWNTWQPWATDASATEIPWDGGVLSDITVVDDGETGVKEVRFTVDPNAEGRVYLEKVPEGLWVRCEYIYQAPYAPIARLQGWFHRSEVALKLDDGLLKLQKKLQKTQDKP